MFVKPAPGRMVRWPRTFTPLREAGEHVPEDSYWHRRLAAGDVVKAEEAMAEDAETAPAQPDHPEAAEVTA